MVRTLFWSWHQCRFGNLLIGCSCIFRDYQGAINSQNASLAGVEAVRIHSFGFHLVSSFWFRILVLTCIYQFLINLIEPRRTVCGRSFGVYSLNPRFFPIESWTHSNLISFPFASIRSRTSSTRRMVADRTRSPTSAMMTMETSRESAIDFQDCHTLITLF